MDILYALAGFAVLGIFLYVKFKEGSRSAAALPELEPLRRLADRIAGGGEALDEEELGTVTSTMNGLYEAYSYIHGDESNTAWPDEDRATYYVAAVQACATGAPDHSGWPFRSDIRQGLRKPLAARAGLGLDPWWSLAMIQPALLDGDLDTACRAYEELERERPDLAELARRWAIVGARSYPEDNDVGATEAFFARIGASMSNGPHPPEPDTVDPALRWALCCALFPAYHRDPRHGLAAAEAEAVARQGLARFWNITDADSAAERLAWLFESGHQAQLERLLLLARTGDEPPRFKALLADCPEGGPGILAWDLCRAVATARSCVAAGFISEEEGRTCLLAAAATLRETFASWEDLAQSYRLGDRFFALIDEGEPVHGPLVDWLLESPESPWRTVSFQIDPALLEAEA